MAAQITTSLTKIGNIYHVVGTYKDRNGNWKHRSKTTKLTVSGNNKRKAEKMCNELLEVWRRELDLEDGNMLFSEYLKLWLEDIKQNISKNTYFSYRQTIYNSICPYFEKKKIKLFDLKPYNIQDFYKFKMEEDKVSANTIHHYHANIHKALKFAVQTERIDKNPADNLTLPKKDKHIANFYSLDEVKSLLEYAKESSIEVVIKLAAWFGLRRGEIIGLKWEHIDFDNKILYVVGTIKDKGESGSKIKNLYYEQTAKTSSSIRSFPMHTDAVNYLSSLKSDQDKRKKRNDYNHNWDDFVCVRDNGDLIPLEYVSRAFPNLCQKAGLKRLTLHELRHTNISLLLDSGSSMKELQEWAGHGSYRITVDIKNLYEQLKESKQLDYVCKMRQQGEIFSPLSHFPFTIYLPK